MKAPRITIIINNTDHRSGIDRLQSLAMIGTSPRYGLSLASKKAAITPSTRLLSVHVAIIVSDKGKELYVMIIPQRENRKYISANRIAFCEDEMAAGNAGFT